MCNLYSVTKGQSAIRNVCERVALGAMEGHAEADRAAVDLPSGSGPTARSCGRTVGWDIWQIRVLPTKGSKLAKRRARRITAAKPLSGEPGLDKLESYKSSHSEGSAGDDVIDLVQDIET